MAVSQSKTDEQIRLMKGLHFSSKDLDANRSGQLSHDQRYRIRRQQTWEAWICGGGICLMGGCAILVMTRRVDQFCGQTLLLFIVLIISTLVIRGVSNQRLTRTILRKNQVSMISDRVNRTIISESRPSNMCTLTVRSEIFLVHKHVGNLFQGGEHYTLYYVPETYQLLSAELTYDHEKEKRLSDDR